jgi:hypothetical protein
MVCLMLEYVWVPFVSAMVSRLASLDAEDQSNGFVTGGNRAKISGESSVTASTIIWGLGRLHAFRISYSTR